MKPQTWKHIRRKLEAEFGDSLENVSVERGRLLVIPDNLSKTMLATENMKMVVKLESYRAQHNEHVVKQCATILRSEIKKSKVDQPWPPQPGDLNNDYTKLPKCVYEFLHILLAGKIREDVPSGQIQWLIQSFGQDFIYAISKGVQKPAKHILLPWAIQSLTGNVELIKVLNRFGHGISYSQPEEIDTALCLQKLANGDESGVVIPSNMRPGIPTNLAYDNIDRIEENTQRSGNLTQSEWYHSSASVPSVHQQKPNHTTTKSKTHTIHVPTQPLPPYDPRIRVGPLRMEHMKVNLEEVKEEAQMKNHVWTLVRQQDTANQCISSRTGFSILTYDKIIITQDKIGYLPAINAPATELSKVHEVLRQCLEIRSQLNLEVITCVFDQALYAKCALHLCIMFVRMIILYVQKTSSMK